MNRRELLRRVGIGVGVGIALPGIAKGMGNGTAVTNKELVELTRAMRSSPMSAVAYTGTWNPTLQSITYSHPVGYTLT